VFHQSVLQCLSDVVGANSVGAGEVGDRARHFQHTIMASGTQAQLIHGATKQPPPFRVGTADCGQA
jgi:hypothetical protein